MAVTADAPQRGWTVARIFGAILIVYSLAIYEQLGVWFGHGWPRGPLFGIAPCPTTIFTIGLLMLTMRSPPAALMIAPLIWSVIGATAAILFGVPEDLGLLAAGLIGGVWLLSSARRRAA